MLTREDLELRGYEPDEIEELMAAEREQQRDIEYEQYHELNDSEDAPHLSPCCQADIVTKRALNGLRVVTWYECWNCGREIHD